LRIPPLKINDLEAPVPQNLHLYYFHSAEVGLNRFMYGRMPIALQSSHPFAASYNSATLSQLTTFHQALMYSARLFWYLR